MSEHFLSTYASSFFLAPVTKIPEGTFYAIYFMYCILCTIFYSNYSNTGYSNENFSILSIILPNFKTR